MTGRFIVTATPPTPNGDFHVGHFAGPYLGGDIFARYLRLKGHEVAYVSSADRNQSYVQTTAERLGVCPDDLARLSHRDMLTTLARGHIAFDAFNAVDAQHEEVVRDFFRRVEANGAITVKRVAMPYSPAEARYLFESYLSGNCPTCWAPTAGAICENCGHPNSAGSIELPRSKSEGGALEYHEMDVGVLELEAFRDRIAAFYAEKRGTWRPHLIELVDELLDRPLPDYPLTYPGDWGIPSPITGTEGQVLNVWAEMLPGLVNSTELAGQANAWGKDSGTRLVQFLGYDNSFFFAVVHLALAMAHEDCVLPDTIITNEFFELDNFKFSTSKGHLIWARHLLEEADPSVVRFYLALANPETQKMNFTRPAMAELTRARFFEPFEQAVHKTGQEFFAAGMIGQPLSPTQAEADALNAIQARFARFHEARHFSPQRVAEHLSHLLVRIGDGVDYGIATGGSVELRRAVMTLTFVLPTVTAPLMPAFSADLSRALGRDPITAWRPVTTADSAILDEEAFARASIILPTSGESLPMPMRKAS